MEGLLHPKQAQSGPGKDWGLSWQGSSCLLLVMLPGQAPAARCLSLLLSLQPLHQGTALPLPEQPPLTAALAPAWCGHLAATQPSQTLFVWPSA